MSAQHTGVATPAAPLPSTGKGAPAHQGPSKFLLHRFWKFALVVAIVMVVLALLGVALTTTDRASAKTYWVSLVPVYGLACVIVAWRRAVLAHQFEGRAVLRQVFHWLGIGTAISLDFLIRGSGSETGIASGENALLLLALGCYLAGVHLDRVFILVGLLLMLVLVIVAKAEQYQWLIFVVGGVMVAAMIGSWWVLNRYARKHAAAPAGS